MFRISISFGLNIVLLTASYVLWRSNKTDKYPYEEHLIKHCSRYKWWDLTNTSLHDVQHLSSTDQSERHFFFFGNSVTRHYAFALERVLANKSDHSGTRHKAKMICPKTTSQGCTLQQVRFMWKNWPWKPPTTPTMPAEHLLDGCSSSSSIETCIGSFLLGASANDVLVVGSNYAYTSICRFGNESDAYKQASKDLPKLVNFIVNTFPGLIVFHTLGPVRENHERPAEHRWIPSLNNVMRSSVAGTRIVVLDTYSILLTMRDLFEDVIHHPGLPSEAVVKLLLQLIQCCADHLHAKQCNSMA